MSKHVTVTPAEAADRLAIRELVEAYAHCADRRDAKAQVALFTEDTHFVVYMNAKDPKPSQVLHSRAALAPVFDDLNNPPTLLTDLIFAGVVNLAQRGTMTPVWPRRLAFTRRRANEAILRRHFRCELRFDAPHDLMVFDEATLALPMVHRNAQLLAVLVPGLDLALSQDDPARTLADRRTRRSGQDDLRRPSCHREGCEVSGIERAHAAAAPRRAWHDVPGPPRRCSSSVGTTPAHEHEPRHRGGRVSARLRGGQLLSARLSRLGRDHPCEMARER